MGFNANNLSDAEYWQNRYELEKQRHEVTAEARNTLIGERNELQSKYDALVKLNREAYAKLQEENEKLKALARLSADLVARALID